MEEINCQNTHFVQNQFYFHAFQPVSKIISDQASDLPITS